MKLEQISVSRFRSAKQSELAACGQFNVLIGKNNCGKSTLLSAINTFFVCVADAQIIALDPPFGDPIDFHRRNTALPIEIEIHFSLTASEHTDLVRELAAEAPQMRNAIDNLEPDLLLSVNLSITSSPARFAFVNRIALASSRVAQPSSVLFAMSVPSATELQMKHRNSRRARFDSEKLTEAAKNIDEDDFRRIRDGGAAVPRSYLLRSMAEVGAATAQTFESLLREASNHKEFRRLISATTEKLLQDAGRSQAEPLKHPVDTFAGSAAQIPDYVHFIMRSRAGVNVLYLNERRRPLGREEAQRLLDLKVRRGGNEALRNIQETVRALLGVHIDAFESSAPSPRGKSAEMDVDEFLLEVNGAGIREALRLVLDYEFNHPMILLVEEPEVHLHPALEFAMMRYLKRISSVCQVFLSTHSTNFLDGGEMTNVYLVAKNEDTTVQLLNLEDAQARIPKELGLRLSSLFMFDRLVFVEGPSDEAVLREFANKTDVNLAQWNVGFISMGGVRNFAHYASEAILSFLTKRQVDIWFVLDHDEKDETEVEQMKARLQGRAHLHILQKRELENYLVAPRAISAFLEVKLQSAPKQNVDSSPDAIRQLVDKCADELKGLAVAKRLARHLCKPAFASGAFTDPIVADAVKPAIIDRIDEQIRELTKRRGDVDATFARESADVDHVWTNSKRDLAPGPELLDRLFRNFGVRFRKETDSSRLASHMLLVEIDAEIRDLLQSLVH